VPAFAVSGGLKETKQKPHLLNDRLQCKVMTPRHDNATSYADAHNKWGTLEQCKLLTQHTYYVQWLAVITSVNIHTSRYRTSDLTAQPAEGRNKLFQNVGHFFIISSRFNAQKTLQQTVLFRVNKCWGKLTFCFKPLKPKLETRKCCLRLQSVPQREHQTLPLQRSTG